MYRILFFAALVPVLSSAQTVSVSGFVTEEGSGERLSGALVALPASRAGTAANAFGFYSLIVPAGDSAVLTVTYATYLTRTITLPVRKDTVLNIALQPEPNGTKGRAIEEVTVRSRAAIQDRTQMSSIDLPIQTIKSLPAFLGEVDILKAIQLLPGVQAGSEGSSGLYVRGGGPDQNLILLDGVPVYNASHLFGFFSVFNADAIRGVEVIKGGFPARYGGRLSSVIDLSMKDGNKERFAGEGGVGLIASRVTLEGPILKNRASFMVSGRRTYADLIARPFMPKSQRAGYYFYDLNGKVNARLGKRDHVYLSGYFGEDKFSAIQRYNNGGGYSGSLDSRLVWGNATAITRWNHQFGPKLFGNATAHYSRYGFLVGLQQENVVDTITDVWTVKYNSGIEDWAGRYDLDWRPHPAHNVRSGLSGTHHTYTPGAQQFKATGSIKEDLKIGAQEIEAREYDAYVEDDFRITTELRVNAGVHATAFRVRDETFTSFQPRLALRYLVNDRLSVKGSFVQMAQFIHLLTNSSVGLPTDLWVPATNRIPPMRSKQGALGMAYTYGSNYELSLEGYYKTMENVIEYKEGASFLDSRSTGWEDKVEVGQGWSYGGELFIQKKVGRFSGMLGYTLSWTTRQFDNLNDGNAFPYRYDRRHDFKVAGVYKLRDRIEMSADFVYGTGNAITLPVAAYATNLVEPWGPQVRVYSERNGYRMPAYCRADMSVKFSKQLRYWERAWVVSAYNVFSRRNPFFIYATDAENGRTQFKQVSLFPIIPSISYQFKF